MRDKQTELSLPVLENKDIWLTYGLFITILSGVALYNLLTVSWAVPYPFNWVMHPFLGLMVAAFGFFLFAGISILILCVEKIVFTKEEVRLKVGFFTVRKVSTPEILCVGFTEQGFDRQGRIKIPLLVLSREAKEDILEKAQSKGFRNRKTVRDMGNSGYDPASPRGILYTYWNRRASNLLLGIGKDIIMDYTQDRANAMRAFLTSATFMV